MAGMRDTARQDNMIGLCLFLSSMADSKSAYTTTGAGISYHWFVNRNRVPSLDNSYSSLSLTSSRCACTSWAWTALRDPKKSSQNLHFAFLAVCLFLASLWRKMRCLKSLKSLNTNISRSNRIIIGMQMSSTDRQWLVVGSSVIIVVSMLLFWLAIFRLEERNNDEYTWITWWLRVISITFHP